MIKLSAISVTYKDPEGLARTIESLKPFALEFDSWEHLVVDSSPGLNASVLSSLPPGWPLRHIVTDPKGIYSAMNSGIAEAKGDVIWFLNGGDRLKDSRLFRALLDRLISSEDIEMICAGCDLERSGEPLYPKLPNATLEESLVYRNQLVHQAVIYKKCLMEKVGGFDLSFSIAADYQHYFRCLAMGVKAICVREALVVCDLSGTSSIKWARSLLEAMRASEAVKGDLPPSFYLRHKFFSVVELGRVSLIKAARAVLPFRWLKKAWAQWNTGHA